MTTEMKEPISIGKNDCDKARKCKPFSRCSNHACSERVPHAYTFRGTPCQKKAVVLETDGKRHCRVHSYYEVQQRQIRSQKKVTAEWVEHERSRDIRGVDRQAFVLLRTIYNSYAARLPDDVNEKAAELISKRTSLEGLAG